jgi:FkbM family methyltransferase
MNKVMKAYIKSFLSRIGLLASRADFAEMRYKNSCALHDIEALLLLNGSCAQELLRYYKSSKAQLRQDLFVLSQLRFKSNGYFVEFGATNGIDLSNTYLLEKEFGWTGILAEPAKCWHSSLETNRRAHIEKKCVWRSSNSTLAFNESKLAELSTIAHFSNLDLHRASRSGVTYNVDTISLNDLLDKYKAPRHIDYLSIDTEGSEFEILEQLDFSTWSFEVITCEHNFGDMRQKIYLLLSRHGYTRVFEDISLWDDWYVKSESLSIS